MPIGINETVIVTFDNLQTIANSTSLPEFMVKVNHIVYGGWLYFILLFTLWIILILVGYQKNQEIVRNMMASGAVVTILSLLMRVVYVAVYGVSEGLLADSQMWIFPIITTIIAMVMWMNRN